jgi:hypothetical protein
LNLTKKGSGKWSETVMSSASTPNVEEMAHTMVPKASRDGCRSNRAYAARERSAAASAFISGVAGIIAKTSPGLGKSSRRGMATTAGVGTTAADAGAAQELSEAGAAVAAGASTARRREAAGFAVVGLGGGSAG